jgi:hypothetical protein
VDDGLLLLQQSRWGMAKKKRLRSSSADVFIYNQQNFTKQPLLLCCFAFAAASRE